MNDKQIVPRVMIASPTPGEVKTVYTKTVLANMNDLASHGIHAEYQTVDASGISWQRNVLAMRFLESDCTHIWWVDADMMSDERLCRALLLKQKPVIGTAAAAKRLHFDRIEAAIKRGVPFKDAILFGYEWIFVPKSEQEHIRIDNGVAEVSHLGFGFVLIQREVFSTMIERGAAKLQPNTSYGGGEAFYNFFGVRPEDARTGEDIGEDVNFCRRWSIDCGGELWSMVDATIWHVGDFAYGGNYFDYLKACAKLERTKS